jgi:hypothetical protein
VVALAQAPINGSNLLQFLMVLKLYCVSAQIKLGLICSRGKTIPQHYAPLGMWKGKRVKICSAVSNNELFLPGDASLVLFVDNKWSFLQFFKVLPWGTKSNYFSIVSSYVKERYIPCF